MKFAALHPADLSFWCRLIAVAFDCARENKLPLREVLPEDAPERVTYLGCCYVHAGEVRLVLRFKDTAGNWLGPRPEPEVWETLAHELAHLEEVEHTPRHKALTTSLLADLTRLRRS